MRRRSGRRGRRCFRQGRAVPGIRRYLLCLRNDASDTDSDSIPLSSLLDEADETEAADYSRTLLSQHINPAVCTGLMQVKHCCLLHLPSSAICLVLFFLLLTRIGDGGAGDTFIQGGSEETQRFAHVKS